MEQFHQHESLNANVVLARHQETRPFNEADMEIAGPYHDGTDQSDSRGLIEYWRIIRRNKMRLAVFTFCGMLVAILVGIFTTPVYRAETTLEVLNLNEDFMNMKQTSPETTNDYSSDTSEEETQAELLQSEALIRRVTEKLLPPYSSIQHRPRPQRSWWRDWLHLPEPLPMTSREKLLAKIAHSLKVRAVSRTRMLNATVSSIDPLLAVNFVNSLTGEFMDQSLESRWKTSQKTSDWLSRELEAERQKLESSEEALQAYARDSGLIFTDENTNVATEKLQQVQQELSRVTADRIAKQSRYELSKYSPPDSLPDVLNDEPLRDAASFG